MSRLSEGFILIAAVVPLKVESARLRGKNFLFLGGRPLAHYLVTTLTRSELFDAVFIFCSSPRLLDYLPKGVQWLPRPPRLDSDAIKANELFQSAVETLPDEFEYVFLSQVTSPFLSENSFRRGVEALTLENYDSVFSVRSHMTYAWMEGRPEPLNYDPQDIPRTQDLAAIHLETSGFYGFRRQSYLQSGTRIHGRTKKIELGFAEAIDIDYPEDFVVAEHMLKGSGSSEPKGDSNQEDQRLSLLQADFKQEKFEHVVFDFDGVLIDSLPSMAIAWIDATSALGIDIPFIHYKEQLGLPFPDICSSLGVDSDLAPQLADLYFGHQNYGKFRTYEGVVDSIEQLLKNGIVISILTSKPKAQARAALDTLPFSEQVLLFSPEDIKSGRGKPAPDGLLEVVSTQGIDPKNTLFVGDMEADRECAKRAGIQFFHAAWGYGSDLPENLPSFSSISHLADWILSS